ncbi:hypothetical protein QI155_10655 [Thermodesulfovibrio sp. 1176]|uniref:hypothetical protein n=1 Tax=Thermodesulfovibrio sp. 1176 TaxID=3043424 RepID=UPI00248239CE|nr:hypothetical protein [Thermodesulfovibrio sp. 1176]MDI1472992.1 hypothetical protein [Thermodesulfovibrio sp. 1176]
MHSKVFVLARSEEEINEVYENVSGDEIVETVGADYAVLETEEEFKDSIEWLKENYSLSNVDLRMVNTDDYGEILVAKISKTQIEELIESLKKKKEKRIEKAKEALEKGDLWLTAWEAYNRKGFFFALDGYGIFNDVELLDMLEREEIDKLYVIQSFDYHF